MAQQLMVQTVYHRKDGPQQLYTVDARHALTFSDEWSREPWPQDKQWSEDDYKQYLEDKENEKTKAKGLRRSDLGSNQQQSGVPSDAADQKQRADENQKKETVFAKGGKP